MPVDPKPSSPAILVCAVMAGADRVLAEAQAELVGWFGPIQLCSASYPFEFTDYYAPEMGTGLIKRLVSFQELIDPAALPRVKHRTLAIERQLGRNQEGRILRRVNLDPGLVSLESLVLATTKESGHRICIAPGLHAEVTLLFQKGQYSPLPWTYPDYRTETVQRFLLEIRAGLMARRRTGPGASAAGTPGIF
jgi:hypothetical protein